MKSCLLFILVVCLLIISNVYSQFQLTYFYQVENVPWKDFMTSIPVWAIIVAHVTENWGWYTLLTQLPTYLKTILNFDLQAVCCFYYFINPFLFMIIYFYWKKKSYKIWVFCFLISQKYFLQAFKQVIILILISTYLPGWIFSCTTLPSYGYSCTMCGKICWLLT